MYTIWVMGLYLIPYLLWFEGFDDLDPLGIQGLWGTRQMDPRCCYSARCPNTTPHMSCLSLVCKVAISPSTSQIPSNQAYMEPIEPKHHYKSYFGTFGTLSWTRSLHSCPIYYLVFAIYLLLLSPKAPGSGGCHQWCRSGRGVPAA